MKIILNISEKELEKLQSITRVLCGNSVSVKSAIHHLIEQAEFALGFHKKEEQR